MAFAKLDSSYIMGGITALENIYVSEYMPALPDVINRVYIYGLFLSTHSVEMDNSLGSMAARLNLTEQDVTDSYQYLAEMGLVQLLGASPIEVRYLPVRLSPTVKKYKPAKFADFNVRLQEILAGRLLTPNEYSQYYDFLEYTHMEQDALLMIARFAVSLKDDKIGYSYILTIARNWYGEGVTTVGQVEEKLLESDRISTDLSALAKAMGVKKAGGYDERALYLKWTKGMEYESDTLLEVAKTCKKGGFSRLDAKMTRYYAAKLFTSTEIAAYENNTLRLYAVAREINKKLGLYYEQLDNEVDTYITVWENLGFDTESLYFIADICFKRGVRTLEGLDEKVRQFYRQGLITENAISLKLSELSANDNQVLEVLAAAKISNATVRTRDRDFYHTWTYSWGLSHELILYAATLAVGAAQPLAYINKILADWRAKNIVTVDAAKSFAQPAREKPKNDQIIITHEYTQTQLNSLIDNIDEEKF